MATSLSWLDTVWRSFISREGPSIKPILSQWQQWGLCSLPPETHSLLPMTGGLTNRCWLLHLDSGEFVLRVSAANRRELAIDREQEFRIQQRAAHHGLAPAIRYRSSNDDYWIMEHVRGRHLAGPPPVDDLPDVASAMRQLHQLPWGSDLPEISIAEKAAHYWQGIRKRWPDDDWSRLQQPLQEMLSAAPGPERSICHMDPNPNNWRKSVAGWRLLDWEYAGIGHPLWDIASFSLMGELPTTRERYWCQLNHVDQQGTAWMRARLQMTYLNELWFGVQELHNRQRFLDSMNRLLEDSRRLVSREHPDV